MDSGLLNSSIITSGNSFTDYKENKGKDFMYIEHPCISRKLLEFMHVDDEHVKSVSFDWKNNSMKIQLDD